LTVTDETLTPFAGLALFGEFRQAIGLEREVGAAFPAPGSAKGYRAWEQVQPRMRMRHGGGRALEDLRTRPSKNLSCKVFSPFTRSGEEGERQAAGWGLGQAEASHPGKLRRAPFRGRFFPRGAPLPLDARCRSLTPRG